MKIKQNVPQQASGHTVGYCLCMNSAQTITHILQLEWGQSSMSMLDSMCQIHAVGLKYLHCVQRMAHNHTGDSCSQKRKKNKQKGKMNAQINRGGGGKRKQRLMLQSGKDCFSCMGKLGYKSCFMYLWLRFVPSVGNSNVLKSNCTARQIK